MPNIKMGTLLPYEELAKALKEAKAGQVTFRVDTGKNVHVMLGKIDFTDEQVLTNLREIVKVLTEKRPNGLKGKYFLEAYLKSTMGPRWKINLQTIELKSGKSIWGLLDKDDELKAKQNL